MAKKSDKKPLDDFLREMVSIVAGKQCEEIVELMDTRKHTNEFLIAKKLDITINQTRNILYKLSERGLVSNIRKKDKKKGWYTYFWRIEALKSLQFLKSYLQTRISQTQQQISSRQSKQFYVCERCHIEVTEENALLYDFTCRECGSIFTLKDNSKLLKELEKYLNKYETELKLVEEEIKSEEEKIEKEKEKERKKDAKVKAKKRKARAKERAKTRAKNKKVKPKTKAKKKITKSKAKTKKVKKKTTKKKAKPKKKSIKKTIKKKTTKKKSNTKAKKTKK